MIEYCPGGSLANLSRPLSEDHSKPRKDDLMAVNSSPLTESQIRGILRPVAEGLMFIHQLGLLHSELSLKNIFIASNGRIVSIRIPMNTRLLELHRKLVV